MTREDHLAFCSICKKRSFDFNQGVVCGLTREKPDFENNCSEYEYDSKRDKEIKQEVYWELYEIEGKKHEIAELTTLSNKNRKEVYYYSISRQLFVIAGAILIFAVIIYNIRNTASPLSNPVIYLSFGIFIFLLFNGIKNLRNRDPQLIINSSGFGTPQEMHKWRNIVDSKIIETTNSKTTSFQLIVYCYPHTRLTYNIEELDCTPAQIANSFEYFRHLNLKTAKENQPA